jgi:hypothetical protein
MEGMRVGCKMKVEIVWKISLPIQGEGLRVGCSNSLRKYILTRQNVMK